MARHEKTATSETTALTTRAPDSTTSSDGTTSHVLTCLGVELLGAKRGPAKSLLIPHPSPACSHGRFNWSSELMTHSLLCQQDPSAIALLPVLISLQLLSAHPPVWAPFRAQTRPAYLTNATITQSIRSYSDPAVCAPFAPACTIAWITSHSPVCLPHVLAPPETLRNTPAGP